MLSAMASSSLSSSSSTMSASLRWLSCCRNSHRLTSSSTTTRILQHYRPYHQPQRRFVWQSASTMTTSSSSPQQLEGSHLRSRCYNYYSNSSNNYFNSNNGLTFSLVRPFSTSSPAFFSEEKSLLDIRMPKKGTGFDNFLPKDKDGKPIGGDGKEDNSNNDDDNNNRQNNDENDNRNPNFAGVVALMLFAFLYVQSKQSSSATSRDQQQQQQGFEQGSGGGTNTFGSSSNANRTMNPSELLNDHREISWHDFLRLLKQQDVVKVVVQDDRDLCRVYLRSNAKGLAQHGSSMASYEEQRRLRAAQAAARGGRGGGPAEREDDHNAHHNDNEFAFNESQVFGDGTTPRSTALVNTPLYYSMQIGSVDSFERKLDEAQRALGRDPTQDIPVQYTADNHARIEVIQSVLYLLMWGGLFFVMRRMSAGIPGAPGGRPGGGAGGGGPGGIFQIGKSTHKKIDKTDVQVTFADVAGCDEAKKEIMEFVDFLKDSDRFTKLGAKIPKGALLCGPPGTGKTLLAKAVAGEAGVPFYTISGSDFIEMFVGVGPSRVRDLFSEARQNSPCIVFIDEIDAVGRARGRGGMGGNDERENTLNQLLVEMDGFETSTGVVVLAGTNRVDILDQALTRPGRFDRQIIVDKPDLKGRKAIFKVHLKGITLEDEVEDVSGRLAGLTPGFAGADIANICNEAAIIAARRKAETVTLDDFEKATDRIIGGLESNKIMSKEERSIVAHHEAGHAIAGWFLEHADPLLKVTIIPRSSGALGFAQYLPKEVFLRTQEQIMDIVCMALAGRAAEEIFFGRVTTGASDDLKRVTGLVYSTIQLYGMNSRLGQLSFPKDPNAFYEDRPYSEKTAKAMDEEARKIVNDAYQRTLELLKGKKDAVETVAKMLLDKETITHDDIVEAVGPRPYAGDPAYMEFIQRKRKILKDTSDEAESIEEAAAKGDGKEDDSTVGPLNPGLA